MKSEESTLCKLCSLRKAHCVGDGNEFGEKATSSSHRKRIVAVIDISDNPVVDISRAVRTLAKVKTTTNNIARRKARKL